MGRPGWSPVKAIKICVRYQIRVPSKMHEENCWSRDGCLSFAKNPCKIHGTSVYTPLVHRKTYGIDV